ncbi:MAG: LysR family transcriptional regulator [Hyphomicrobiales bacterium]|jgi:LysR family glycine cleavage system transcriptional activator|nr:MAG: LysR family transcriptional regulator [Hyphomicrobiales bacterium]
MTGRLPPLVSLRAFEATVRCGSISAAARELHVTHGAVSHQIKALEDSLGVPLFERNGRRLKITARGALFFPAVSEAFAQITAAASLTKHQSTQGTLRISCSPALLTSWLIPKIGVFSDRYPEISLVLVPNTGSGPLAVGDVDIAITYGNNESHGFWTRLWRKFELFPIASPAILNVRPIRSIADLSDQVMLHGDNGQEWRAWLAAADHLNLKPGRQHWFADAHLAMEAARLGQGVAMGDSATIADQIASGEVVRLFDLQIAAQDAFYVCTQQQTQDAPIIRVFVDWLFAGV